MRRNNKKQHRLSREDPHERNGFQGDMYKRRFSTEPSWMSEANVCWDVESKGLTNVLVYYDL